MKFYEGKSQNGTSVWLPLVDVTLITPSNSRVSLSLLFDTGASVTTLRADLYPLLGLRSWDEGQRVKTGTGGGEVDAYQYNTTIEVFGRNIQCPIQLLPTLAYHPLFCGLLGRDTVFNEFGFGFWESTHELFVTESP
ncbi:MAG: aspartyl protease family protein [Proteobacteria bacterium]|nr:aspartyl protease family protein [Pseudomonadota bacterium]